ncbi:MAG: hypothetical protein Q8K58_13350 [Acidimicrobiales bacterium]|nr:hypothetical protein [Acidimicrobiales bacterium]
MPGPQLDRDETTWTGSFAGLGTVAVALDGEVTAHPDGQDEDGSRAQALRHGWGGLLSWAGRGFALANAASLAIGERGLLVTGEPDDVAATLLGLARHGFVVLSDRPSPTRWVGGSLVAYPRDAPILVPRRRAEQAGLTGTPVREGSTSVAVDLPRGVEPVPCASIAHVVRQRPDEEALDRLAGTRRFERAATLMLRGALAPAGPTEPDPREVFDEHLRLAALPSVVIRMEGRDDPLVADRLLDWWRSTVDAAT